MTITEKLRTEFPGISVIIAGFAKGWRAGRAYIRALKDIDALKMKVSVNTWAWDVSERSMLSYTDALIIYDFFAEHSGICKYTQNMITEFVIEMANTGHRVDTILRYLVFLERDLDQWASKKLSMRP